MHPMRDYYKAARNYKKVRIPKSGLSPLFPTAYTS